VLTLNAADFNGFRRAPLPSAFFVVGQSPTRDEVAVEVHEKVRCRRARSLEPGLAGDKYAHNLRRSIVRLLRRAVKVKGRAYV
jgi:hypothetical protein